MSIGEKILCTILLVTGIYDLYGMLWLHTHQNSAKKSERSMAYLAGGVVLFIVAAVYLGCFITRGTTYSMNVLSFSWGVTGVSVVPILLSEARAYYGHRKNGN